MTRKSEKAVGRGGHVVGFTNHENAMTAFGEFGEFLEFTHFLSDETRLTPINKG